MIASRNAAPASRRLRVVIDARMDEGSGGVQQWVIGLAGALSRLEDGPEDYRFLVDEGNGAWLVPYLSGHCSLLVAAAGGAAPEREGARRGAGGAPSGPPPEAGGRGDAAHRPRNLAARALRAIRRLGRGRVRRRPSSSRRVRPRSRFDRLMRRVGADIVHFPRPTAWATTLPNIYQPWDLQHVHLPEFFSAEARANRDAIYRRFCDQATRVVVATRWVRDDLQVQYGIAPERIAVVNPAPVTDAYDAPTTEQEAEIAARLALPERFAFYPAQTWGHKNHLRLFEALRRLRDRGIDVPLVCSGRQNDRFPAIAARLGELGLDDLVTFPGFLSPLDIQAIYGRATLLVFPSLYEGWGLPIIEAFAAGVPVACSNATSLPALVGDAGLVFEPTDPDAIAAAIERLWLDDDLRARLATAGRDRIRSFDWSRTARTMRAHYRDVAGRPLDPTDVELLEAQPVV